jgi:hypothetical protein
MSSKRVDYLTEDAEIPSQKFVVMSILTPNFYKMVESGDGSIPKDKEGIYGIKIRGSYSSYDEAQKRAKYLQGIDTLHNVFVGEVGKWLPFDDSSDKAEDASYAEDKLNNLMKSYMENQQQAKQLYEKRKNDMIMETLKKNNEVKDKKKKNKKDKPTSDNLEEKSVDIDLSELSSNKPTSTSDSASASASASASVDESGSNEDKVKMLEDELLRAKQMLDEELNPLRNQFEKVQEVIQAEYGKNKKIE